jgi:hypothetical protein
VKFQKAVNENKRAYIVGLEHISKLFDPYKRLKTVTAVRPAQAGHNRVELSLQSEYVFNLRFPAIALKVAKW